MTDHHDHHDRHAHRDDTTPEDQALLDAGRRLRHRLHHPFAIGVGAVAAAALLFRLGILVGESMHGAFDGDGVMAAAFGAGIVTCVVAIIATGVWLDRRQRTRDTQTGPTDDEHPRSPG